MDCRILSTSLIWNPFFHDEIARLIPWKFAGPGLYSESVSLTWFQSFLSKFYLTILSLHFYNFLPREWSHSNIHHSHVAEQAKMSTTTRRPSMFLSGRAQKACQACQIAKVRCNAAAGSPCQNCTRKGIKCVVNRQNRQK